MKNLWSVQSSSPLQIYPLCVYTDTTALDTHLNSIPKWADWW
uniref:Uncharacterized protein n=1 Tax=Anguilla anguilla TaxID=7936 RepID=A0A0E9RRG2_ANGAN